jgi:hypothetical protein
MDLGRKNVFRSHIFADMERISKVIRRVRAAKEID